MRENIIIQRLHAPAADGICWIAPVQIESIAHFAGSTEGVATALLPSIFMRFGPQQSRGVKHFWAGLDVDRTRYIAVMRSAVGRRIGAGDLLVSRAMPLAPHTPPACDVVTGVRVIRWSGMI